MSTATSSMKVSTRLAWGFGVTVALGVAITVYAALAMASLSDKAKELSSNRMVKVQQFSTIKDNLQSMARHARNVVILKDETKYPPEVEQIKALREQNQQLYVELSNTIRLPHTRPVLEAAMKTEVAYNAALDKMLSLALINENEQAAQILFAEVTPLQQQLFKAVDDSVTNQQEIADSLAEESVNLATNGMMLMIALATLMAAIGGAVGWFLSRNLRTALGAEPAVLSQAVSRIAEGDLSQPLTVLPGDTSSVMANLVRMQASLTEVVSNVRANSESVATASAQIAQGNTDLSQRTEEQASSLQQTAATMEQLGSTVRNNADSARQANQLAQGAATVANQGGAVVGQVVSTMQGISDSSRKIGDIISVIDGIAFQTNILALNAAVEAARAGEQGRGFAVVAGEVRTLAQRSAEAAKEIKALIGRSVEQVEQGSVLVDQAGKTMNEIVMSIQKVSDIVGEITSASAEQSNGVQQVGDAVSQMDQVTQQNAALVEESAAAAESLKNQAHQLVQAVAVFKLAHTSARQAAPVAAVSIPSAPAQPAVRTSSAPSRPVSAKPPKTLAPSVAEPRPAAAQVSDDSWETF